MKPRPDFDIDRRYGEAAEGTVRDLLSLSTSRVEVKHKDFKDARFFLEVEQNARNRGTWTPSGIRTSAADHWVYVIVDTGVSVWFPADKLKAIDCRRVLAGAPLTNGGWNGDNPTRGHLFHLAEVLGLNEPEGT